jgi:hypothetical protein
MSNRSSWLVVASMIAGALLLRFSLIFGGEQNWIPVSLPFPLDRSSARDSFNLPYSGQFALEVITPASDIDRRSPNREGPAIPCKLTLILTGPDHFRLTRSIENLHVGSWTSDSTIYFPEDMFQLPSGGGYTITLSNAGLTDKFGDRGALVQLTRRDPSGHDLLSPLSAWIAYACFMFAALYALRKKVGIPQ